MTLVGVDGHEVAVAAVDEDGTFHLEPHEAGTFQLVARADGHPPEVGWVAVPASGEVVRDVALGDAVAGRGLSRPAGGTQPSVQRAGGGAW